MPLKNRQEWRPTPPPNDLDDNEEVFHNELTNEIFRSYNDYYNSSIECNSLIWGCSIRNHYNLTFQEAVRSERKALKDIRKIPMCLQRPVVYLASIIKRRKIDKINDDLFTFIKERFFVGENVEVGIGKSKTRRCYAEIVEVVPCKKKINGNGKQNGSSEDDEPLSNNVPLKPNEVEYVVELSNEENQTETVQANQIKRFQGSIDKKLSRLLLKACMFKHSTALTEVYFVKDKYKKSLNLQNPKWSEFFVGPQMKFISEEQKKTAPKKTIKSPVMKNFVTKNPNKTNGSKTNGTSGKTNGSGGKTNGVKTNGVHGNGKMSQAEKKRIEEEKKQRLEEEKLKMEEMKRRMEYERIEREKEKERKRLERERLQEEMRQQRIAVCLN